MGCVLKVGFCIYEISVASRRYQHQNHFGSGGGSGTALWGGDFRPGSDSGCDTNGAYGRPDMNVRVGFKREISRRRHVSISSLIRSHCANELAHSYDALAF